MKPSDRYFVKLSENDNVVTVTKDMKAGTVVNAGSVEIVLKQDIPFGHKFAVEDIEKGGQIVKYGVTIGVATTDIEQGEYVHIHNVEEASLELRDEVKKKTIGSR
jgi:altronate dehydratase